LGVALILLAAALGSTGLNFGVASAGTETGEFCPTCPDWTNFDSWLAKKEAYDRSQESAALHQASSSNASSSAPAEDRSDAYPVSGILTRASAIGREGVILDVRAPAEYQRGHIPGARNLFWRELQKDGALDSAAAEKALRTAGVNSSDSLLIYGGSDEGAAFVFWVLCYLGQQNVSLLDGGVEAAQGAGIFQEKSEPSIPTSDYSTSSIPWLLVTPSDLDRFLSLSDVQILDARDFSDFGMGRLSNSSIPLSAENLYEGSKIRDSATLEELLGRRGLSREGIAIVYGTPQAYRLFFALRLMGYNATLIEGDWWKKTRWLVSNVRS